MPALLPSSLYFYSCNSMFLRNWVTGGIVAKMRGFFILLYKSTLNGQIVLAEKCGSLRLRSHHHQLRQDDGCHLAGCVFVELVKGEAFYLLSFIFYLLSFIWGDTWIHHPSSCLQHCTVHTVAQHQVITSLCFRYDFSTLLQNMFIIHKICL